MSRITSVAVLQTRMVNELTGCPQALMVQALMDAARDFCTDSEAWQEELEPIDIVEAQLEYDLAPEYDAHIKRLIWVKLNTEDGVTNDVDPTPLDERLYELRLGDPEVLVLDDSLEPTEDITDALTVKAVLVPEFNSLDIAEWFLNRYWKGIVGKAMHSRMMDPNKRWTNPTRAAMYYQQYMDELQNAGMEVTRQHKNDRSEMPA